MSSPGERAAQRLNRFAAVHGDAVRLARLASLAVRIDAPLLRALRMRFLRGSDACIEADLWFSPLTESMSSQGFVLAPQVAEILRSDLAAETVDGKPLLLDAAAGLIDDAHRDWPPSLRMEERITWLALRGDPGSLGEVDALLRQAAKSMVEDAERGMDIARWALRALPRLPAAARATEAALLLALGASARLGGRSVLAEEAPRANALPEAAWILPADTLARRTTIGLRRLQDGIEFLDADAAPLALELPDTTPLVVELRWSEQGQDRTLTVGVQPGRRVAIPAGASAIRVRTLAGDEFALESAEAEVEESLSTPDGSPLLATAVRVHFKGTGLSPDDFHGSDLAGFFISADLVLTMGVKAPSDAALRAGAWTVAHQDDAVAASVAEVDGKFVLLRLPARMRGAVVLERAAELYAIEPGTGWESVGAGSGRSLARVGGTVDTYSLQPGPILILEPEQPADGAATPALPLRGAPVLIGGRIVGQVRALLAQQVIATPAVVINDFVFRSLRPAEHEPTVFVACAAETRTAPVVLDRVKKALLAARVRPWIDFEQGRPGASFDQQRIAAINDSEGAAIVMSHEFLQRARDEALQMVAYRRWAKPDYPVAMFGSAAIEVALGKRFGRLMELFQPLQAGPAPDDDSTSDTDLAAYAGLTFEALGRLRDTGAGEAAVMRRAATLVGEPGPAGKESALQRPGSQATADEVEASLRSIQRDGLFARIDWPAWLQVGVSGQLDTARRELIDIAAMFTVPAKTAQRLRSAAIAPQGQRAICLNAMPVTIARALIQRAWIGEAPPVSLVFREQDWPRLGSSADAPHRVAAEVGRALDCDEETAQRMLQQVSAPVFLIFATRPLPSRAYLDTLQKMLPRAVLFFLCGAEKPDYSLLAGGALVELPSLGDDQHEVFIRRYKELMQLAAPRKSANGAPDRSPESRSMKAARKNPKAAMPKGTKTMKMK